MVQHELADRELIGVVVSDDLVHGDDEVGYCIIVTRDNIIGAKKPGSLRGFRAYMGPDSNITDIVRAKATKVAEEIMGTKEFSIPAGSIGQILFKKPGMFFGGYVIIKRHQSSLRIDMRLLSIGGPDLFQASDVLAESLRVLVGERLRIMRNGFPVSLGWPWTRPYYSDTQSQMYSDLDREDHLRDILTMLGKHKDGLSNAEIDAALSNYSQWTTSKHLRELMAMGLIEYKPELFGDPGKYIITDLGVSVLRKIAK